jgi:hypothetical protein
MSEPFDPTPTLDEIARFAASHGLTNLPPEQLEILRGIYARMVRAGRAVPRMPSKLDPPAVVFVLPTNDRKA